MNHLIGPPIVNGPTWGFLALIYLLFIPKILDKNLQLNLPLETPEVTLPTRQLVMQFVKILENPLSQIY